MAAEDIYKFLKTHRKFYSARQIAGELNLNQRTVSRSLNIIARYDDIVCKQEKLTAVHSKIHKSQSTKRSWVYAYVKKQRR